MIEFSRLNKLQASVMESDVLASYGQLSGYDKALDRVTARTEHALKPLTRLTNVAADILALPATDDPILNQVQCIIIVR